MMTFFEECMTNDGRSDAKRGLPIDDELLAKHPKGRDAYLRGYNDARDKPST